MSDEITVGDRLKDNDPRMPRRVLRVFAVGPDWVRAADTNSRLFTIKRHRIYTDGKPRRNGFDWLPSPGKVTEAA